MPLSTGQVLNNRYRIVKLLGQGGFGAVYRAWDMNLNVACALKENLDTSPEAQRQFAREATLLATLRHPNLPRVGDHFSLTGQGQYLVMDYVEGEDLQAMLDRSGGPLSEAQVMPWIIQVCQALTYLHTHHPPVIHRDIKPANIKITPEGQAVLVDFGIAKTYDPNLKTTLGARAVTPGYSPPEQYGQGKTDARSDIYSLGATLYTLLTGQVPPDSVEIVTNRVARPLPVKALNPRVSQYVSKAVEQAMQTDWKQRYGNAAEFATALQPHVQPTPNPIAVPLSPTTPILSQPARLSRTRPIPWIWILGGVLGLALLFGGGWVVRNFSDQPNPTPTEHALVAQSSSTPAPTSPTDTLLPPTPTGSPFPPPVTQTVGPLTLIPTLGISSFMISEKDGMKLMYVPAGEFLMGSANTNQQASSDENPQHTVYLDAFWIDQTEVTIAMYRLCVQSKQCQEPQEPPNVTAYADPHCDNFPVMWVSWDDAQAYCQWAGRRLPTEAQWEKAARGSDGRTYPWGEEIVTEVHTFACGSNAAAVGSNPSNASPYGILDLVGNVSEWVADWYSEAYYATSPSINPIGPPTGHYRILRGGSWGGSRSTTGREWSLPYIHTGFNGIRCALDQPTTLNGPPQPNTTATPEPRIETPTPTSGIGSFEISKTDGMKLLYVPAGEFLMGSTEADKDAQNNERPQHTVYLDAFWIDQTEVTNAMYRLCVQAGVCEAPYYSAYYPDTQFDNYPVASLFWHQAQAYCRWAGRKLPTEAQWEKAARGSDGRTYPWGEGIGCDKANYSSCNNNPIAVGSYPSGASPYGALDMGGNVWEWVADWYDPNYYASSPFNNPTGPLKTQYHLLRGGSWGFASQLVRTAERIGEGFISPSPIGNRGFRCAR